jgi:hypothetical protein
MLAGCRPMTHHSIWSDSVGSDRIVGMTIGASLMRCRVIPCCAPSRH